MTCSHATVGIVVNPLAGTDVRRLVSSASPTPDVAKVGVIRRAVIGAVEGGATRVLLSDDRRALSRRAIDPLALDAELVLLPAAPFDTRINTVRAARELHDREAGAVIVIGGDGTSRDVALGWRDAPMIPLSTGTNNVFPRHHEATIAGHAAGAVASGRAAVDSVGWRATVLDVAVDGRCDLALVDLALIDARFTGSRAVWDAAALREVIAAIAEPHGIGLSAVAAAVDPIDRRAPGAVHVVVDDGSPVRRRVPLMPGSYADVGIAAHRRLAVGESVELRGPGVLAFDGERDIVLADGEVATATVAGDGPLVIDVEAAMAAASAHDRGRC